MHVYELIVDEKVIANIKIKLFKAANVPAIYKEALREVYHAFSAVMKVAVVNKEDGLTRITAIANTPAIVKEIWSPQHKAI